MYRLNARVVHTFSSINFNLNLPLEVMKMTTSNISVVHILITLVYCLSGTLQSQETIPRRRRIKYILKCKIKYRYYDIHNLFH